MVLLTLLYPLLIKFEHGFAVAWLLALFKFYPVLISVVMFIVFGYSLFSPPTIIERIARLHEPNLPSYAIIYTRRVTQVWCGFFIINGGIALITAVWAAPKIWSLYNGIIAYLLMGLLFCGEYLIRLRFKRQQHAH